MQRLGGFFAVVVILFSFSASTGRSLHFDLDQSVRAEQPLCFKEFRVISNVYSNPATSFIYFSNKPVPIENEKTLLAQLSELVSKSACKACVGNDTLTIAVQDFRFHQNQTSGGVMSLYMNIDFFVGSNNALHHIYTLDTMYQRRMKISKEGYANTFISESVLQAVAKSCFYTGAADAAALSNQEAAAYYVNMLKRFPLYNTGTPPVGVYKTVDDFINLRSIDTPLLFEHIPQMETSGFNYFYYKTPKGKKGKKLSNGDFYAASDGKNLWLSFGGSLHKITRADGELLVEIGAKMLSDSYKDVNFGLVGYLASVAIYEEYGAKDGGAKELRSVMGKFAPDKRTFVPYGAIMPAVK